MHRSRKRKPLGIFWLEFCELAQGAPRSESALFRLRNRIFFGSFGQKAVRRDKNGALEAGGRGGWGTLRRCRGVLATRVAERGGPAPAADGADAAARPAKLAPRAKSATAPSDSQLRDGTRLLPM